MGDGRVGLIGIGVNPNDFVYAIAVRKGVCQGDRRAEAPDRRVDVGTEEDVVLAVSEQNQGGTGAGAEDGEARIG